MEGVVRRQDVTAPGRGILQALKHLALNVGRRAVRKRV